MLIELPPSHNEKAFEQIRKLRQEVWIAVKFVERFCTKTRRISSNQPVSRVGII